MGKLPVLAVAFAIGVLTQLDAQPYKEIYVFNHPGDPDNLGFTISQSPGGYLLCSAGAPFDGMAFEMSTGGAFKSLHVFTGPDGSFPASGLVLGTDQRFHGTTLEGGKYNHGTVFRLSPDGKVIVEHSFYGGADGELPQAAPIQSIGGHFYGVTAGPDVVNPVADGNYGSVYRISAWSHEYRLLHTFSGPDGATPYGPLVQGNDGRFYGMTSIGGTHNSGTIFRVSANGDFKVLYNFDGTHGSYPWGALIQASDGYFYGVAAGGAMDSGVAFRMTPAGSLTVLHNFDGGNGGYHPTVGLLEATDGNFYGTTDYGGSEMHGILFRLTPTGEFTKLHDFEDPTGILPGGALLQHTNGKIYGSTLLTNSDPPFLGGATYEFDLGLHPFVTYLPVYGRVGAKVVILGQDFQNNSIVSFNGKPAQDVEIHPTFIKAIVPAGATTGPITVATSKGGQSLLLKSNKTFVIH